MIAATKERIYGIDIYKFYDTQRTPFQLTFEKKIASNNCVDIALVNLLGKSDSKFCKYLRSAITSFAYEYLQENKCKLFFDIELKNDRSYLLLLKFLRWIKIEPRVNFSLEITVLDGSEYVEVFIELNEAYIKSLEVTDNVDA